MTKEELLQVAKPILFNTEMVKAILDGRKTVTRRVINWDIVNRCDMERDGTLLCFEDEYGDHIRPEKLCRYKPGNILYVRETWSEWTGGYVYRAWTGPFAQAGASTHTRWYPSIHMPKEAARIFLKVKDVRVERLQEMNEVDTAKEGIRTDVQTHRLDDPDFIENFGGIDKFKTLWNSTIKKEDMDTYGWDASPYVWVIEFERIEVE